MFGSGTGTQELKGVVRVGFGFRTNRVQINGVKG